MHCLHLNVEMPCRSVFSKKNLHESEVNLNKPQFEIRPAVLERNKRNKEMGDKNENQGGLTLRLKMRDGRQVVSME